MDAASTDSPPGHDTQNPVGNHAHGPFDDNSKNPANEEPAAQNNATDNTSNPPLSDDNASLDKKPDMGKQKELIVKLKFETNNAPDNPSDIANMDPGSAAIDHARNSALLESSRPSGEDMFIKPESEYTDDITPKRSDSIGTHKAQGDESSNTALAEQPLNEDMNEFHQTNTPKYKTVPEEYAVSGNNGLSHDFSVDELPTSSAADDVEQVGEEHDETDRLFLDTSPASDKIPVPDRDVDMLKDEDMVTGKQQVSTLQSQGLGMSPLVAEPKIDGIFGGAQEVYTSPMKLTKDYTSPRPSDQKAIKQPPVSSSLSSYNTLVSPYYSKQPLGQNGQGKPEHFQQLERQIAEKKQKLEEMKKMIESSSRQTPQPTSHPGHQWSQPYMQPASASGSLSYQRASSTAFQPFAYGNYGSSLTQPMASPSPYGQMISMSSQSITNYSMDTLRDAFNMGPGPSGQRYAKARPQVPDKNDCGEEEDDSDFDDEPLRTRAQHLSNEEDSDDDEPLRTRVKRHPSVMSQDSTIHIKYSPFTTIRGPYNENSASSFITANDTPSPHENKPDGPVHKNPVRKPRSLPQPLRPATSPSDNGSDVDPTTINWSLPRYECLPQPTLNDLPSAKISLPGLVREELLLSPDHSAQETHLLLHLFLPGQQALAVPDPEPAAAILNFHTIAIMVIECFVQYEIGDELGLGRGHFHDNHDDEGDNGEYERVRDAKDADVDEIFFAVVDRWRAGRESKKESLRLIRGAQEFCDQALDVIYYIKENGLLRGGEGKRKSRVRTEEEMVGVSRKGKGKAKAAGTKRGTVAKPNQVGARKKTKVEAKVEVKKRAKSVVVKRR
ncbi:hypothetical protein CFE70_006416 [Pyrenophora teres f. teres 0-1]|uniref:Uncharacterized protein n=2 Tax=Pyrenophora teres f. teres TaxID=97479 RepID=E3RLQ8_PYRTT|nr:hypothetical protein PTT_09323 [Pyrenophora teres f. teres 0-1]KAE8857364.1 hypothetical protein PTNB29_08431 [Pyrenophora teres f. teres]CAE7186211.1 hypothetical protein PTTW11_06931 [Pyrenophora teres f. teres]